MCSWKEFGKWKIGPEHQKKIGMVDRSISAAISQQTRQPYGIGVVVLQPLLTAQRVADRRLQSRGQFDYLLARVSAPIAAKNRDGAGLVNHVYERFQIRIRWSKHRGRGDADINRFAHGVCRRDVPGNGEHGGAFLDDRSAYCRTDDRLCLSRID